MNRFAYDVPNHTYSTDRPMDSLCEIKKSSPPRQALVPGGATVLYCTTTGPRCQSSWWSAAAGVDALGGPTAGAHASGCAPLPPHPHAALPFVGLFLRRSFVAVPCTAKNSPPCRRPGGTIDQNTESIENSNTPQKTISLSTKLS